MTTATTPAQRRHRALVVVLVLALFLTGCRDQQSSGSGTGSSPGPTTTVARSEAGPTEAQVTEVTATILGEFEPPEAPGSTMYLYRVVIPPGAEIAPHHHPGQQIARIESGTLTYTALEGTLELGRDSATPNETVEAPATVEIDAGDSVFEAESLLHEARNDGDEPVVIVLSSLLGTGEELSIPADDG